MALFPWRFQANVAQDETDPVVTVFIGPERSVMDDNGEPTGEIFVQQDTSAPVQLPLSELPAALANPSILADLRQQQKHKIP